MTDTLGHKIPENRYPEIPQVMLDSFPRFADMPYWFLKVNKNEYDIILNAPTRRRVGVYVFTGNDTAPVMHDINGNSFSEEDYVLIDTTFKQSYMRRPEWLACNLPNPTVDPVLDITTFVNIGTYENALVGVAFMRAYNNGIDDPDRCFPQIQKCLDWLRSTDFYVAPASTKYHEAYEGGLLTHSLRVAHIAVALKESDAFIYTGLSYGSVLLTALTHDWCKINMYESYTRNVKNDATGVWEQVRSFRRKDTIYVPMGHGEASAYMTGKMFKLSLEETLAIRWHMAHWRVADDDVNELQYANENYPLVHLIQFADQLAITNYSK